MATWQQLISEELTKRGEDWPSVVSSTLSDEQLNEEFHDGYGSSNGEAFTLWTSNRVYFPVVYDGREWVESVARNPDGVPTEHVGGQ